MDSNNNPLPDEDGDLLENVDEPDIRKYPVEPYDEQISDFLDTVEDFDQVSAVGEPIKKRQYPEDPIDSLGNPPPVVLHSQCNQRQTSYLVYRATIATAIFTCCVNSMPDGMQIIDPNQNVTFPDEAFVPNICLEKILPLVRYPVG